MIYLNNICLCRETSCFTLSVKLSENAAFDKDLWKKEPLVQENIPFESINERETNGKYLLADFNQPS